ncbi:CMRF35-like molecule 1 isoform X2 [Nothobranchius furzeri]|uniref:CMRF35-like molecule 1 isoform X2 n=1 Tax=Nothobranchius furzeri TaxID=105023 RepID=UPI00390474FD
MIGTASISWRAFLAIFVISLQIHVMTGIKPTFVSGMEGTMLDFKCEYSIGQENRMKYFHRDDAESDNYKTMTKEHNTWVRWERFSVYDNTTGAFFIVRVDKLYLNDSGRYRCGVSFQDQPDHISLIHLDVSKVIEVPDSTNNHTGYETKEIGPTQEKTDIIRL